MKKLIMMKMIIIIIKTEKPFTSIYMKKGDVGMAKHFSKKVREQGVSFRLPCICNME